MGNGRRERQAGASQGPLRLSTACTRRWTLRKQYLTSGGEGAEVATVASDLVGLHATDPLTPYLSLFARVPGFAAESLDSALYETHDVVRVPAMRNTVFVVARSQLSTVLAATRAAGVRSSWRFFADRLTREQYERAVPQIIGALRGRELTVRELKGSLSLDCDVSAAVKLLCDEAVLVRAHPVGDRRASQHAYALMSDWLPDVDAGVEGDEDEALTRLVRAYLHTYGPVDQADIAWWTGATKRRVRAALAALSGEVSVVTVDGREPEMLMLGVDLAELRAAGVLEPAGLTLLPPLDPYTQGYADRGRFLDVAHAPRVVDRKGNVTSTVLLDGRVVDVWELAERPVAEVRLHLFAPIGAEQVRELRTLAERVACFVLGVPAPVVEYRTMLALTERAGWVRSPFRGASDARPLAAGAPRDGGHGSRSVR